MMQTVEEQLLHWFVSHHKKLAFAESCTGGLLASRITSVAGASDYFLGSFVVYTNEMKEKILGVSKGTLLAQGAVSEKTAQEMLEGVFKKTSADYAIAVSGIAGPTGALPGKPVGTICAAIGKRGESPEVNTFLCRGSRQEIISEATNHLLDALLRVVRN